MCKCLFVNHIALSLTIQWSFYFTTLYFNHLDYKATYFGPKMRFRLDIYYQAFILGPPAVYDHMKHQNWVVNLPSQI